MKTLFKNTAFKIWFSVTVVLVAVMIAVGCVAPIYYDVINIVIGGPIAVYADGRDPKYVAETESKEDALIQANALNEKLCEEGTVLLKNEDVLPLANGAKISVFGKNSVNLVYGGSGSGGGNNADAKTLYESLSAAGFVTNPELEKFYRDTSRSGPLRNSNPSDLDSGKDVSLTTGETPYASYDQGVTSSYGAYSDAALVVLSRIGGEGFDLPRMSADDEARHYLEPDPNEQQLLENVTAAFDKVVVIVNSSSVMELDWAEKGTYGKIGAVVWIGGPGNSGIMALGKILNGTVNPSGRTVDTWAGDLLSAPSVVNFGTGGMANGDAYTLDGKLQSHYFVDYEESIYVGYRYYETRGTDETWYAGNVVYPFGYGLSYTSFTQTLKTIDGKDAEAEKNRTVALDPAKKIKLAVEVTNTGSVAGKEVVQVYVTAPYHEGEIEKPYVVLSGFAKTGVIAAGGSEIVEIEIDPYDFASYDDRDANGNGFTGYELDGGDYIVRLQKNAHEEYEHFTARLAEGKTFGTDPVTGNAVENRFQDASEQLGSVLTRTDWEESWPKVRTDAERSATGDLIKALNSRATNNPETYGEISATEKSGEADLYELISAEDYAGYDDPRWEEILNALSVKDMADLYNHGAFKTIALMQIGKPKTTDADGPVGFCNFMGDPTVYDTCSYASEVALASTWNRELIYEMGKSVGEEGLWGNVKGDGAPYSGWYAPGANIHRNPFGGRNFEYFSEDPFLSGMMAASEIEGAASKGVYCFIKHFAVNDQETHRSGVAAWLTEQSLREIYLKPFEIAVKEGNAHGVMSSFNRIGTKWTGGDYRLLTEVLRNEWGFRGTVICDFNTSAAAFMNAKQMIYAGGDLNLTTTEFWDSYNAQDAGDVAMLRRAAKNVLYTVSESNALNAEVLYYMPPLWVWLFGGAGILIVAGLSVWGVFAVRRALKKQ